MTTGPIFTYAQPEENEGYLLWQVSMRWQLQMNQRLRTVGLTLTQFSLLAGLYWLSRQGEVVAQQRLADYAQVDRMMTSKVVQALEKKGFVERSASTQDGRAKQLRISPAGEALLRRAYGLVQGVDAAFFGPILPEMTVFKHLMRQLAT